jgi:chromosome segregation ATPase
VADNSAALRRARQHDSATKRARAREALNAMEHDGEPVTFPAVARRAGVSVSLLYADADLAGRIATLRDRQRQAGIDRAWRLPARSLVTEQSLRVELANARERARRLGEENGVLHERLRRHLGAAADIARGDAYEPLVERLEQRAAELESDNHRQRQRITQLESAIRELSESLDAARAMNRELMSELNRPGGLAQAAPRSPNRRRV